LLLYVFLFGILAAREEQVLPDNGWTVVIILGPVMLYVATVATAHIRAIRRFMKAKGLESSWSKRHKARQP
jgi:hypothetical protein